MSDPKAMQQAEAVLLAALGPVFDAAVQKREPDPVAAAALDAALVALVNAACDEAGLP